MQDSRTQTQYQFSDGRDLAIGTMYCIGRNYAAHAREMGAEVSDFPVVFLKPPAAYVPDGGVVRIPDFSTTLHYEVELVVVIGAPADNVAPEQARACIAGYAVGLDMTLRDVQARAKERGEPWASAKGFRTSAPLSTVLAAEEVQAGHDFELELLRNGQTVQRGSTAYMERSPEWLVAHLSRVFGLRPGDCIFTGTPEGVGQAVAGDILTARLDSARLQLQVSVADS